MICKYSKYAPKEDEPWIVGQSILSAGDLLFGSKFDEF